MTLVRGDSYRAADGRALIYSIPTGQGIPDLTVAEVWAYWYAQIGVLPALSVQCTIQNPNQSAQQVQIELGGEQTNVLGGVNYLVALVAYLDGDGSESDTDDQATLMRIACTVGSPPG